jgi:radical SAM superfamily enzyme YgiQ (UPF0313 family)
MASRILLISANRCISPDPVFPLGLAHLNAALREAGHECVWLDSLAEADRFAQTVKDCHPDLIGISLRNIDDVLIRKKETFFDNLASLCSTLRQQLQRPIVLGGSGFSIFPRELLELSGADFGIAGEGESGLLALVAALEDGTDYRAIPGLVFRREGQILVNQAAPHMLDGSLTDRDRPPSVAAHYLSTGSMLNLQTQRRCAFRC